MIDDTSEVRWSNAWWRVVFVGIILPVFFLGLALVGMLRHEAYVVGRLSYRLNLEIFHGFPAHLIWCAYAGIALAAWANGYARNHPRLDGISRPLTALGLVPAMVCVTWAVLSQYGLV